MDAQAPTLLEAAAQLASSAWLHRVVNGGAEIEVRPAGVAAIDREYAVGSGRIDLLVRWPLPEGRQHRRAAVAGHRRPRTVRRDEHEAAVEAATLKGADVSVLKLTSPPTAASAGIEGR